MFYSAPNNVLWYIVVELQICIVFPLIVYFFRRSPFIVTGIIVVICTVYRTMLLKTGNTEMFFMHNPLGILDGFVIGMLMSKLSLCSKLPRLSGEFLILVGATLFYILCKIIDLRPEGLTVQISQIQYRPAFFFSAALVCFAIPHVTHVTDAVLGNAVIKWLSGISLNVYLWHQWISWRLKFWHIPPFDTALEYPMYDANWRVPYTLTFLAATLAASIITTYFVEKPISKLIVNSTK